MQASEGSSFGIVPFLEPKAVGAVSAVVGAWGNIGAICWGMLFLFGYSHDLRMGFRVMGIIIMAISFVTFALRIEGQSHLMGSLEKTKATPDNLKAYSAKLSIR